MKFASPIKLILTMAIVGIATAMTAYADTITVSGTTQGSFNGGAAGNSVDLGPLHFQGAQGATAFSTLVTTGNPAVQVDVGRFLLDLNGLQGSANGHTFSLFVSFTAPPGAPGGPQTFTANLTGTLNTLWPFDQVTIDFVNTPQVFAYTGGTFSFSVNDVVVTETGPWVNVVGNITATSTGPTQTTATPEPLSMLLLGTGIAGVAFKLRKRHALKK